MKKSDQILRSFINASCVFLYVLTVAWTLSNAKDVFGESEEGLLIPVFMLLLFIVSATITGSLVLGKPILLYINGLKKEAFILLFATVGWLFIFLLAVMVVLMRQ